MQGKTRSFYKDISSKGKTRENIGLLLNEEKVLVKKDSGKTEVPSLPQSLLITGLQKSYSYPVGESLNKGRFALARRESE